METDYEIVHTISDFYDGPRSGVADFNGKAHFYQCVFDEAVDNWSDKFKLSPLDAESFQLALEEWAIWQRWQSAYHAGLTHETHPALDIDRQRFEQLKPLIAEKLKINPDNFILAQADFRRRPGTDTNPIIEVKWTII